MNTPNLRTWQPDDGDAKDVKDTKMLNTVAHESVDMNESNDVGKEYINTQMPPGPFGAMGRN